MGFGAYVGVKAGSKGQGRARIWGAGQGGQGQDLRGRAGLGSRGQGRARIWDAGQGRAGPKSRGQGTRGQGGVRNWGTGRRGAGDEVVEGMKA